MSHSLTPYTYMHMQFQVISLHSEKSSRSDVFALHEGPLHVLFVAQVWALDMHTRCLHVLDTSHPVRH